MGVGLGLVRLRHLSKPREADRILCDLDAKVVNAESLFDEAFLGCEEVGEVSDRHLVEWEADGKASGFIVAFDLFGILRCEAIRDQVVDDAFQLVCVLAGYAAFLVDRDVADLVSAGRHTHVDCLVAGEVFNGCVLVTGTFSPVLRT